MSILHNSYFIILTSILAAAIPTYLIRFSIGGIPTTLYEVFLWLVTLLALNKGWLIFNFWKKDPLRWPIVLMILASLMALVMSPDLRAALGQWKVLIVDSVLFYWLVREASSTMRDFITIETGVLAGGTIVALQAVISALLGHSASDGRVIGLYAADLGASPNYLALYLTPLTVLILLRFFDSLRTRPIPTLKVGMTSLSSGLMIAAIALSGSRGGLAALFVGVGVGLLWQLAVRVGRRSQLALVGTALVLGLLASVFVLHFALPDFMLSPETGGRIVSSNNIRWEIWQTTVSDILPASADIPYTKYHIPIYFIGLGFANYQTVFTELTADRVNYPEFIAPLALHPHNFLLMTWVTLGLLGVIAWLSLIVVVGQRFRSLIPPQIALAAAVIAWFVQGLVDTTFYKNDLAPLWFLLAAGLLVGNAKLKTLSSK